MVVVVTVRSRPVQERVWLQLVGIPPGASSVIMFLAPPLHERRDAYCCTVCLVVRFAGGEWITSIRTAVVRKGAQVGRYVFLRTLCILCIHPAYLVVSS